VLRGTVSLIFTLNSVTAPRLTTVMV
jgi:hypothetical protein